MRLDTDHVLNLLCGPFRLRARQIDLVDDRHDLKAVVHREIDVCKRLRLDPLRRIHNQYSAFTSRQRTADLIVEVHVPGRVDEIKHISFAVGMRIEHPHRRGFDRDAALALDVHRVEQLLRHISGGDGVRQLHHPVGQRRFAVVDMRDDGKIPNQFVGVSHVIPSHISGFIILYLDMECKNEPFASYALASNANTAALFSTAACEITS